LLGVRTAKFKYIRAPRPELYDLSTDADEIRDIARQRPDVVARLDALLAERLAAAGKSHTETGLAVALSAVDRERLRSLGYVVPNADSNSGGDPNVTAGPDPKDHVGLLQVLAEVQRDVDAGRLAEALVKLDRTGNDGAAVRALRASIAVATGDFDTAEADSRAVLASQPNRADVWSILGRALAGQARLVEARASFEATLLLAPESVETLVFLGRVHEELGEADAAEAVYQRARSANASTLEATWRLATLYLRVGEFAAADALLGELENTADLPPSAVAELAVAEARAGRAGAARRRLAEAHSRHPEHPELARAAREIALASAGEARGPGALEASRADDGQR
jgi:tetratricopeptide (TPR) repeat protein